MLCLLNCRLLQKKKELINWYNIMYFSSLNRRLHTKQTYHCTLDFCLHGNREEFSLVNSDAFVRSITIPLLD